MHELSIAQGIVEIIRQYVPEDQEAGIRRVRIRIGRMAGVIPDSLDFCFDAMVQGTPMGGARLDIEEIPVQSCCTVCGRSFHVEGTAFSCPGCGSSDTNVISGTEIQVVEIELTDPPGGAS